MEKLDKVKVGGKNYQVIKSGRAHAEQVLLLTRWFSRHGIPAIQKLQSERATITADSGLEMITEIMEALTTDALMDLFTALIGCAPEVTEVHFDINVLIDVLIEVYERQTAIRRLVERFFFTSDSEEESTEESSMTSEQPTDGQTEKS